MADRSTMVSQEPTSFLVVGGGGLIGGTTALMLRSRGYDVTIGSRRRPDPTTAMAAFDFLPLDYTAEQDPTLLRRFDAVVFAAGNDVRHKPADAGDEHFDAANSRGVPRFFAALRDAGVPRAINVGSFYTQAAPHLIDGNPYIRSRWEAEEGVRRLAAPGFATISVNAPLVIGALDGASVPFFERHLRFALGELQDVPEFVPTGGVNFISTRSLAEAIVGALERGESGASYLVGDENLTFAEYFAAYFEAAGRSPPPAEDRDAPIFPDRSIYFGRGNSLFYDPDPEMVRLLDYRRYDVRPTIRTLVREHLARRDAQASER